MLVTAIFAWLHIASAIAWLGGGIMFVGVIAPALARLSPQSSGEFFVKVAPRIARFFQIVAGTTVLFGVILILLGLSNGDFGPWDWTSKWTLSVTIGLSFGFVAFLMSEFVAVPPVNKAIRLIKEMQASGAHQPSPELPKTLARIRVTGITTVGLLLLSLVFMVSAGFF